MHKTLTILSLAASTLCLTASANAFSFAQSSAADYSSQGIETTSAPASTIISLMKDYYDATGKCAQANSYEINVSTTPTLTRISNSGYCTLELTFAAAPRVSGLLSKKRIAIYPGVTQNKTLDWNSLSAVTNIENNPLLENKIKPGAPVTVCSKTQLSSCSFQPAPFNYAITQTQLGL